MIVPISIQLVVATLLLTQGSQPDLSGRWEIDKSLSTAETKFVEHPELSGPPAPVVPADHAFDGMRPQTITHREPSLLIVDEPIGREPARTLKLSTDGKENTNELPRDGGLHRSSTRWEEKELVTEWSLEHDGSATMRGTDRRSLSDSSTLIDERTILTPLHETRFHIVWIKKKP